MVSELTITVKDEEKTLKKKFLMYETYTVSDGDDVIRNCIAETLKGFDGTPAKITAKITMVIE